MEDWEEKKKNCIPSHREGGRQEENGALKARRVGREDAKRGKKLHEEEEMEA